MENGKYSNNQFDNNERKAKAIWRNIGIGALAVFVAVLTVVVINL